MTRFVVDAGAVLHLASAEVEVSGAHKLLAPTLLRSQTLSALHEAVERGEIAAVAALLILPASAVGTDGPGVVNFPNASILPVQDGTAHGYLSPAISTLHTPSFCWELSLFTRSQPLFAYLRRGSTARVVTRI